MIRFFLMLFLFVPVCLFSGELENFENDVEYLEKSYKEVASRKTDSAYKNEYRKRLVGAKSRAYKLQRAIEKLGIKRTSLDTTLDNMISFMNIGGVVNRSITSQAGSMAASAAELRSQIKYLKELNYSFEANTFEDPYPESGTYEAVDKFFSLFKQAFSIAQGKGFVNESQRKKYDEILDDMKSLGKEISMTLHRRQFKLPPGFDLNKNLDAFSSAAEKVLTVRAKKDAGNSKNLRRYVSDKGFKDNLETIKYAAGRLENDIEYLKKNHFSMRVRKENLKVVSAEGAAGSEDEITAEKPLLPFAELWKKYTAAKEKVFLSENKIRGISQACFDNYRKLLTLPQQEELDALNRKYVKDDLDPELARSMAMKTMHTKYRFKRNEYSAQILTDILKKNGLL